MMTRRKWQYIGGGCRLDSDRKLPCDWRYENTETGELVTVYSTEERHFTMPLSVDDPTELVGE